MTVKDRLFLTQK